MPRLIWAPSSRRDLVEIKEWLAERDVHVALQTVRAIRLAAGRLASYPQIGRALDVPFRALGVRGTPYLLVYRLTEAGVEVIRVRHGREDWLANPEGEL